MTADAQGQVPSALLRRVIDTQSAINSTDLSPERVMQIVVDEAASITGATSAVVELAEGDEMVYRCATANAASTLGIRLAIDGSLSGLCVSTRTVLRSDDTETDPRVDAAACRRVGARSMVVAPLHHDGQAVGVLKVLSSKPQFFGEDDIAVLEMLAGFIGPSLAHASAFEATNRALSEQRRLSEALDEFSSHVAHDLKSPLATIAGLAGVLSSGRVPPAEADRLLEGLTRQASAASNLVDDLLRLARASRTPSRVEVDLDELVSRLESDMEASIGWAGPVGRIVADPIAVRQALTNLVGNALHYGARDGPAEVEVACARRGPGWRLEVRDRGPGLASGETERVFREFERGAGAPGRGTGLGLAIVSAVARAHHGHAGYQARPGGGAVFYLDLPAVS